jgi:hypothetical protein
VKMNWAKTIPTEEGFYWWKKSERSNETIVKFQFHPNENIFLTSYIGTFMLTIPNGLWGDKIEYEKKECDHVYRADPKNPNESWLTAKEYIAVCNKCGDKP